MMVLDCHSRAGDPVARSLSNFTRRLFVLDGVVCGSMEGFLQSLKCSDLAQQEALAYRVGYPAFKLGQSFNGWKREQLLYWRDVPYARDSLTYQDLLDKAYDAQYDQSPDLRELLRQTAGKQLRHLRGKHDSHDTVLTESEYVARLERLRWRALEKTDG